MPNVADSLADIEVFDPTGAKVRLAEQWRSRPVVLMFIRHFG